MYTICIGKSLLYKHAMVEDCLQVGGLDRNRKRRRCQREAEEHRMKPGPSYKGHTWRFFKGDNLVDGGNSQPGELSRHGQYERQLWSSLLVTRRRHCGPHGQQDTGLCVDQIYTSTQLRHGAQLFGQTLTCVLLGRHFLNVINICNQLTFGKADYPP